MRGALIGAALGIAVFGLGVGFGWLLIHGGAKVALAVCLIGSASGGALLFAGKL